MSCVQPGRCTAVGGFVSQAGNDFVLVQEWNGASWRLLPIASPDPEFSALYGVSCPLATRCVAVGETGTQRTLAERWDGGAWRKLPTPSP